MSTKGSILAVDDTREWLMLLRNTLASEGYDVRPAENGELALASVAATKPDVILLDVRMPGMDGFEVCRRLKASRETSDIPVVFVSAMTEVEDRIQGLKLGAVDFVSKPFIKAELLARIATHLEVSRLRRRLEQRVAERTAELMATNEQLRLELAERTRVEQALRESEERFRSMADHAPAIIWTTDPDIKADFCNREALNFTGRPLGELLGDRWKELLHPEDLEHHYPNYMPLLAARKILRTEDRIRRADGEYRWLLGAATPRFLANGDFAGYIGVMIDITDLKRNHQQLSAAQRMQSLGGLVSGVTHRFGNVLGTILAEADLVLSDTAPGSAAHESGAHINAAALQASEILSLLNAYSGDGRAGAAEPIDLSQTVEETLRLFRCTVPKKLEISATLARKLPPIRADLSQIRQVVMNLLTNAWEALQNQQGSIRVTTSGTTIGIAEGHKKANLPPGNYIRLGVADTGPGISEADLPRIFDPFYTTKGLGRGLGLAAVQGVIRRLGGEVYVQSVLGRGSTFEVLLPCPECSLAETDGTCTPRQARIDFVRQ